MLLAGCNHAAGAGSSDAASTSAASASPTSAAHGQPASSAPARIDRSADVSWTAPTTNINGSALTDLAGFRIYYGTSSGKLNQTIDVPNAAASDYVVQGLAQGTWYFAVAAYTNEGLESGLSSVASKTIT
jgi:hypothetical protein